MRGIYRYEAALGHWWACVDDDGQRVNLVRERYELLQIQPPFDLLPIEADDDVNSQRRRT
jgi:hypothetical protein